MKINTLGFIAILISLFILFSCNKIDNSITYEETTKKASCPSVAEMEEAISMYKDGKIISYFDPNLNTVYISQLAEQTMSADDLQVLGYITACYSGYKKGNNLHWVEIYASSNHKKLAKYSEGYGFKLEK